MTTAKNAKLTPAQRKGLECIANGGIPHGNVVNKLTTLGLVEHVPGGFDYERQITEVGAKLLER